MIEEEIRIRDRFQFEIKLAYTRRKLERRSRYEIGAWLFIPQSLGVNRSTYSKQAFYQDLQSYIRFKTPSIPLGEVSSEDVGPLKELQLSISNLGKEYVKGADDEFELRLKLFNCIAKSAMREAVQFIADVADRQDREQLILDYLDGVGRIKSGFRALRARLLQPSVPDAVRTKYAFADEYLSLMIEGHSYRLLDIIADGDKPTDEKLKSCIVDDISHEIRYRQSRSFPSIPAADSDNEELIFRRNVLKKYTDNVLFLDTRRQAAGQALEQTLFGVAAGVSMFFATVVHFYSQSIYGALSLPVFLALVIGYVFKDRIKDLLRLYFSRKVASALFDHKTYIYRGPGRRIGQCRESFEFVNEDRIPDQVMRIRNRDHITEIESEWLREDVILYRKRTELFSGAITDAYRGLEISGLNDIMRFNIGSFVQRSGNPGKELFVLQKNGHRRVKGERVYHVNMIVKYGSSERSRYKRLRIVLNRRRIKRIETVSVEEAL